MCFNTLYVVGSKSCQFLIFLYLLVSIHYMSLVQLPLCVTCALLYGFNTLYVVGSNSYMILQSVHESSFNTLYVVGSMIVTGINRKQLPVSIHYMSLVQKQ